MTDRLKGLAKGGWHPGGKNGGKESWRGDFKGVNTVAGWMGKGKDTAAEEAREHQSAPLSTLKDPSVFGPPPKHVNYHGVAAVPNATTPDHRGLGVPLTQEEKDAKRRLEEAVEAEARAEAEAEAEANRPTPDTSGLSTTHLPKPPTRRLEQTSQLPASTQQKPKPKLPPRLPPRQNPHPDAYSATPPPPYNEDAQSEPNKSYINQEAMDRLGQSGISVPGFNIGRNAPPPVPLRQTSSTSPPPISPPPPPRSRGPQLGELQSRFVKMSTSSPAASPESNTGTSLAQKQAALKTANSLRTDPSKVSISDMRASASTANNFRERHGEQVASGWRTASGLNQKYGVSDRVNNYTRGGTSSPPPVNRPPVQGALASPPPFNQSPVHGVLGKKPPPLPPPKKKELLTNPVEPPPLPLSTKPKF
ncbi:hypothetical protein K432DRAFT_422714 [Lepidopterella palustris CBS 459.81]|uniref:Altered inheritance of mitochondria protein 3 n=1 Tax=Lepidopterella palustris CBS 459.81 TaxID=1314670 RepID=A0A8E2JIT2_9PEZI|nr:hypothetical protein K432DRAFT_422714 [Lepidopterella palustris CBS 459.81]